MFGNDVKPFVKPFANIIESHSVLGSYILLQLHLEGSNDTPEESQPKGGHEDFFASEVDEFTSTNIMEEPATALVKPKSPRDPVKNGDDGAAPDVSMAMSGEVRPFVFYF